MYLVLKVIFTYHIYDNINCVGETTFFNTVDELKTVIKNSKNSFVTPYDLNIGRTVEIIDTDAAKNAKPADIKIQSSHNHPIVLGRESINFIVSDKLMYPHDVRKVLKQKHGNTLDFDKKQIWTENQPVYYSGTKQNNTVNCRHLTDQDIIIDTQLKQIWPLNTNQMPKSLIQLLSKTKEVIH